MGKRKQRCQIFIKMLLDSFLDESGMYSWKEVRSPSAALVSAGPYVRATLLAFSERPVISFTVKLDRTKGGSKMIDYEGFFVSEVHRWSPREPNWRCGDSERRWGSCMMEIWMFYPARSLSPPAHSSRCLMSSQRPLRSSWVNSETRSWSCQSLRLCASNNRRYQQHDSAVVLLITMIVSLQSKE